MSAWTTQADCRPILLLSPAKNQTRAEIQLQLALLAKRFHSLVDMLNSEQRLSPTRFKIRDLKNGRRTFVRGPIRIEYGLEIPKWTTGVAARTYIEGVAFEDGLPDRTSLSIPPLADGSVHPSTEMTTYRLASLLHDLSLPMIDASVEDAKEQERAERIGASILAGCAALLAPALDGVAHSLQLRSGLPFGPASLQCGVMGQRESAADAASSLEITKALPSMADVWIVADDPHDTPSMTTITMHPHRWEIQDFAADPLQAVRLTRECPYTAETIERWAPRDRLEDNTDFF